MSDQCIQIHGIKKRNLTLSELLKSAHPSDINNIKRSFDKAFNGEGPYEITHRIIREETKEERVIFVRGFVSRDKDGSPDRVLGIAQDVTDIKKLEKERLDLESQLRQKYKMEAVGVMAGGMAHNFNNNLAIILGNIELSKRSLPAQSGIEEYLDYAQIAAVRSQDLIKQIMTYSRNDVPCQSPLQLSQLLEETVSLIKSTIPSRVYLQLEISPDCEQSYIQADASQVQECLLNLCNNAVHALNEEGELFLGLERVELKQEDISPHFSCSPGDYLRLRVRDNGCGIPAEILEKIFDPFFTTKELFEGTGMGLSTVRGIVEQHFGMITVESIVGREANFNLFFPVIDQVQKEMRPDNEIEWQQGSERILFVDDDEMITTLSERILSDMGYRVTTTTDSLEALEIFSEDVDRFDLVMTDQTMPKLTGTELIQKLTMLRQDIPTILCTGYSSKVNEEEARQIGISAFMMKPFTLKELSKVVREVLKN